MIDILLENTLDFNIVDGDLSLTVDEQTDFQDLNYILNLNTGDLKQYPLLGTNLVLYKNGVLDDVINAINAQLDNINLPIRNVYVTNDNKLKIDFINTTTTINLSLL
ncbi:MAG: hypothetical protein EBR27_13840 [Betaproteobacteria bacterium]|nr:hypothetical protein [Betaproteobacteria bacterium]